MVATGCNDLMRNSHGLALLWIVLVWDGVPFFISIVVHVGIYLIFMKGRHFIDMVDIIIDLGVWGTYIKYEVIYISVVAPSYMKSTRTV